MLPAHARLRRSADFTEVVRHGRRAAAPTLVAHVLRGGPADGARVGFVVSGKVGGSVQRHRLTRQLRALVSDRLATLPADSRIVIRARPEAVQRSFADLGADLDRAVTRAGGAG